MVSDVHHGSWFCLSSQRDITDETKVVVPRAGSRQGCTIGAILFEVFFEHSLQCIRTRMRDSGITIWFLCVHGKAPWETDATFNLGDVVWVASKDAVVVGGMLRPPDPPEGGQWIPIDIGYVDDELFFVMDPGARWAHEKAQHLLDIVVDEFTPAALKPNLKKGKTEVVATWRSPGFKHVVR